MIVQGGGDRLEEMWRNLGEEIKRRERDLAVLKKKFETLDAARLLLISDTPTADAAVARLAQREQEGPTSNGLQQGVLEYLHHSTDEDGSSVVQVTNALKPRFGATYKNNNSFYTSVLITLVRLTKQGKAKLVSKQGAPRRYVASDSTRSLFVQQELRRAP